MESRVEKALAYAVEGAIVFATGLAVTLPVLLTLEHMVILMLFGGGVALVVLRWLFLWTAPWMAAHSPIVAFVINAVVDFCRLAWLFFAVLEDALSDLLSGVENIADALGADIHVTLPKLQPKFDSTAAVSARQIHEVLTNIVETCHPYDEAWKVIYEVAKAGGSTYACSVVRYVYPVPWLRAIAEPVLAPFYDGSADPFTTHDAAANCIAADATHPSVSIVCSGIGAGYVVLEVLVPLLLAAIVVVALWKGVKALLYAALEAVVAIGGEAVWLVERIVAGGEPDR
jgi:hypothetical protein